MSEVTFTQIFWSIVVAAIVWYGMWKLTKNETLTAFVALLTLVVGLML